MAAASWLAADLDADALSAVQRQIRVRVLRIAVRHGVFTPQVAAELTRCGHGGRFSLHAAVRLEAEDRAGLERLLRHCATRLRQRPIVSGLTL